MNGQYVGIFAACVFCILLKRTNYHLDGHLFGGEQSAQCDVHHNLHNLCEICGVCMLEGSTIELLIIWDYFI